MSGTKSSNISGGAGGNEAQCDEYVNYDGNERRCRNNATTKEDGKNYCSIHAPSLIAERARKKAEKAAAPAAADSAALKDNAAETVTETVTETTTETETEVVIEEPEAAPVPPVEQGGGPVVPPAQAVVTVAITDNQMKEALAITNEAMASLARISNMNSHGWPENTPVANYQIILKETGSIAMDAMESLRSRVGILRKQIEKRA